jgi:NADPH:quinone reductase-like Zn-dependent oxidoreductase
LYLFKQLRVVHPTTLKGVPILKHRCPIIANSKRRVKFMKAVLINSYGGYDVLTVDEVPHPTPREGEVLIRVHASSINLFDSAVRNGYLHQYFNYTFPLVLGTDVSGVVEELGAGVTEFAPGDEVYTRAGVFGEGGQAEYVRVPAANVARKPQSLDHLHSAALPHVSLVAWYALVDLANLSQGQTILIHGAAGGVGHIAVQLARLRGAKVIGTASQNLGLLKDLKVDEAIDYTSVPFEEAVKEVDMVLDLIGGDTQERSWKVLKPGGILVTSQTIPASQETAEAHGVRAGHVNTTPPMGATLTELARLVDEGKIQPVVSTVLTMEEVRKGHELIEAGHTRGKIGMQIV